MISENIYEYILYFIVLCKLCRNLIYVIIQYLQSYNMQMEEYISYASIKIFRMCFVVGF